MRDIETGKGGFRFSLPEALSGSQTKKLSLKGRHASKALQLLVREDASKNTERHLYQSFYK